MPKAEPKCKYCRRVGEKLFLKGQRCHTPKCAVVRKPYPPGVHGKRKGRRRLTEYGRQLREKQKLRWTYGVSEGQMHRYFREAAKERGAVNTLLIRNLESRLDNVVFRLGFAESRAMARQLTSHGHILVNGASVTIPSRRVFVGDEIAIKASRQAAGMFANLEGRLKKYAPPAWLELNKETRTGRVASEPMLDDAGVQSALQMAIEFYSR